MFKFLLDDKMNSCYVSGQLRRETVRTYYTSVPVDVLRNEKCKNLVRALPYAPLGKKHPENFLCTQQKIHGHVKEYTGWFSDKKEFENYVGHNLVTNLVNS